MKPVRASGREGRGALEPSVCQSADVAAVPGKLDVAQTYNDDYRGWPVTPVPEPHPIRASFIDDAPPEIHEIRYDTPAETAWTRRPEASVARFPQAGPRLDKTRLSGKVDVRVHLDDPRSFIGWFADLPWPAAPHHPFRVSVGLVELASGRVVFDTTSFRAERSVDTSAGPHFAPGADQNLPADGCMAMHRTARCDGIYWFRLFPKPYWDTTSLPNGRYRFHILAWDVVANESGAYSDVTIRN